MTHPASFKNTWHGTGYNGKRCELQPVVNNVKSKRVMDKNMKKTILASLTVAAALVASAPLAKADAFLELVSGSASTSTTISGSLNAHISGLSLDGWDISIEADGSAHISPSLVVNLNSQNSGHPTSGLSVYYSSGSYVVAGGTGIFAESQSGDSLAATASLYTSSSFYTGSGSLGTQFMSTLSLPSAPSGNTYEQGAFATGTLYVTEEMDFGGGSAAVLPGTIQNMNETASLNVTIPDGGLTMVMLGSSILLLAGIRSRLSKKS